MKIADAIWKELTRPHIWMVLALGFGAFSTVVPDKLRPYFQAAVLAFNGVAALTMQWTQGKEPSP